MQRYRMLNTRAVALAAVLAAGLAAVAPVRAEFDAPVTLSRPNQDASKPQVAIDSAGRALVVWQRDNSRGGVVQARVHSAAGIFRSVENVSGWGGHAPQVAMDVQGDAVIVWLRSDGANDRVQARARSRTGVYGPIQTLSPAGQHAFAPQIAMNAGGDALIVWALNDRIQVRAHSTRGGFGPIETLSLVEIEHPQQHPQVAIDANGDGVIVWSGKVGGKGKLRIQARARSSAGLYGPIQTVTERGPHAREPQVAIDAEGNAVIVWVIDSSIVQARARSAAGVLGRIETVGDGNFGLPQVAMSAGGDALVVWSGYDGKACRIQARARSATGVYGPVETLSSTVGRNALDPQVSINAAGDAVVVWHRRPGRTQPYRVIEARARSGGVYGPIQTLSEAGQHADEPQVALSDSGKAVVVWQRSDGANVRIQAAADDGDAAAAVE